MGGGPPSHSPAVSLRFLFATEIAAAAREAIVRLLGRGMRGPRDRCDNEYPQLGMTAQLGAMRQFLQN